MTSIKKTDSATAEDFMEVAAWAQEDVAAMAVGDFFKGALGYAQARGLERDTPRYGVYVAIWIGAFDKMHGGYIWTDRVTGRILGLGKDGEPPDTDGE